MKSINYSETLMVRVSLRVLFVATTTEFVQTFLKKSEPFMADSFAACRLL
jgi:hypothetical protein